MMKNVIERAKENGSEAKIASFKVKQKQDYRFKKKYAAIRADRKTVMRRVVNGVLPSDKMLLLDGNKMGYGWKAVFERFGSSHLVISSPYQPGDILYVRETFCRFDADHVIDGVKYAYKANSTTESGEIRKQLGYKWRPSIHMPREAARIFLRVTDVRVERLQDITEAQAIAEGFEPFPCEPATVGFVDVWNSTIKPSDRALYGWDANPWVWVIEFERIGREEAQHG